MTPGALSCRQDRSPASRRRSQWNPGKNITSRKVHLQLKITERAVACAAPRTAFQNMDPEKEVFLSSEQTLMTGPSDLETHAGPPGIYTGMQVLLEYGLVMQVHRIADMSHSTHRSMDRSHMDLQECGQVHRIADRYHSTHRSMDRSHMDLQECGQVHRIADRSHSTHRSMDRYHMVSRLKENSSLSSPLAGGRDRRPLVQIKSYSTRPLSCDKLKNPDLILSPGTGHGSPAGRECRKAGSTATQSRTNPCDTRCVRHYARPGIECTWRGIVNRNRGRSGAFPSRALTLQAPVVADRVHRRVFSTRTVVQTRGKRPRPQARRFPDNFSERQLVPTVSRRFAHVDRRKQCAKEIPLYRALAVTRVIPSTCVGTTHPLAWIPGQFGFQGIHGQLLGSDLGLACPPRKFYHSSLEADDKSTNTDTNGPSSSLIKDRVRLVDRMIKRSSPNNNK
ncbi:hypothetical protein Bbelb_067570 [Branchiostoma belcheri]|nr:hypothetical protein Bbelb_067570 [Branchiostoma belcheri]